MLLAPSATQANQAAYITREKARHHAAINLVESASLVDRKEAMAEYVGCLQNFPEQLADRTVWLLNGSYGYGVYLYAMDVANNSRMNRAAWFGQTLAALDFNCPARLATKAFLALPQDEQARINGMVIAAIESWKTEQTEQA